MTGGGGATSGDWGLEGRSGGAATGAIEGGGGAGAAATTGGGAGDTGRAAEAAGAAAVATAEAPFAFTGKTVRHTEQRARTPPAGTLAGSTRKTV